MAWIFTIVIAGISTAQTASGGAYTLSKTVVISVAVKKYMFAPQVVTLTDHVSGLTLAAQ